VQFPSKAIVGVDVDTVRALCSKLEDDSFLGQKEVLLPRNAGCLESLCNLMK